MNQNNYSKGDRVQFETRKDGILKGTYSHKTPAGVAYIHGDNGKSYERVFEKIVKISNAVTNFAIEGVGVTTIVKRDTPSFDINKRFGFLESLVRMVISRKRVSLLISGEGGLGKTYTVKQELEKAGLIEGEDFIFVKGYSTAKGLYNTLYEHQNKLIIFDDCDEIQKDPVARNILKGALDSYDTRQVNWNSDRETDVPNEFIFSGAIIFISNMSKNKIDQAITSRVSLVDVTMSIEDKLTRMRSILNSPKFKGAVEEEIKEKAFKLLEKHAENCRNLNLRTLIEIIEYASSGEENWEELSEYVIYSS